MDRIRALPALRSQPSSRALTFFAILLPLIPLRGLVVPADSAGYLRYIEKADSLDGATSISAKQYVGIFFHHVDAFMPHWVFTNAVFFVYLWFVTIAVRTLSSYLVAVVVTLPMYIHFNYVSKESILGFVAVLGVLSTVLFGKRVGQVVLITGVVLFTIFIRPYYVIPIVATALIMVLGRKRGLVAIVIGAAVVLTLYPGPLVALEGSRRQMYTSSILHFGTRTVYPHVWISDHVPFQFESVVNYFVVLYETAFPLLWTATLKDFYAQLFVVAIVILAAASAKASDRLFSTFGLMLMLTVPFFSPDLGTSLRHIAAAALFLHLGIALRRMYDGGRLPFRPQQVLPVYALDWVSLRGAGGRRSRHAAGPTTGPES